jgi:hypothetical protein
LTFFNTIIDKMTGLSINVLFLSFNIIGILIANNLILITDNDPAKHKRNAIRPLQGRLHLLLLGPHRLDNSLRPHTAEMLHRLHLLLQLFHHSCVSNEGYLYCCSIFYDPTGPYFCGSYPSCQLDNTDCGGFAVGSWVLGSLAFLSLILIVYTGVRFKKLKQLALMNAQNNGSLANMNQGYGAPNIYNPNQQMPNQPYQQNNQPNQANYQPPRYYTQN